MKASESTDTFYELVWSALVKAALALLAKALPFFGLPVIGPIVGIVVGIFADLLYGVIKEALDIRAIAIKNEEHRAAFDSASVKLRIIAKDHGPDSSEFKEARDAQKAALAKFVRFA